MLGLLIFLALLIAYITLIFILKRKGLLEKYNCSLWGPLLMWKTERGKDLIERIAKKKRFWIWFANIGIAVCFIAMIGMSLLLLWDILVVSKIPAGRAPSPRMMIGLPGINPFIPIGYGILALVVGIVVHEFSHGILARVGNIKVKSLGLLFFIVPLGAFTEPDEDELKKVGKKKRARVFAAGPMANIVVALVCILLFSFVMMGAVRPATDGVGVTEVCPSYAADEVDIKKGMIITEIQNESIESIDDFNRVMNTTSANQTIKVTLYWKGEAITKHPKLTDKYEYYKKNDYYKKAGLTEEELEELRGKGFLGISLLPIDADVFLDVLQHPFSSRSNFLNYLVLPFSGLTPICSPIADFYITPFYENAFWILANSFYWIFWLNFALGTFNALPAVPLDGGYLFKDGMDVLIGKMRKKWEKKKRERVVSKIVTGMALLILVAILSIMFLPRLLPFFI